MVSALDVIHSFCLQCGFYLNSLVGLDRVLKEQKMEEEEKEKEEEKEET